MNDREFCEWVRLRADATANGAVYQRLIEATDRLIAADDKLNVFEQAVEHVTDHEHPTRSFSASEGWTMIANSRYTDLLVAEEQLAEAREAARTLYNNPDLYFADCQEAAERWPWLET